MRINCTNSFGTPKSHRRAREYCELIAPSTMQNINKYQMEYSMERRQQQQQNTRRARRGNGNTPYPPFTHSDGCVIVLCIRRMIDSFARFTSDLKSTSIFVHVNFSHLSVLIRSHLSGLSKAMKSVKFRKWFQGSDNKIARLRCSDFTREKTQKSVFPENTADIQNAYSTQFHSIWFRLFPIQSHRKQLNGT